MILFLESETPVDICMIQLYMHVMATANDDMLKSQVQVKCQCMQLFTLIYIYIYIYIWDVGQVKSNQN